MATENYKYDVFISYRWVWPDRRWVRKRLAPALRRAGLDVWLEISNSYPACDLYEETENAIRNSRKAICVISPAYVRETEKKARMVAVEFRILQRLSQVDKNRVVPLLLRGKIPTGIHHLTALNWVKCRNLSQEWEKLLAVLEAKNREAPPPSVFELCLKRIMDRAAQISAVALAAVAVTWLSVWSISQLTPIPRLTIKTINGVAVTSEMLVTPSGSLNGDSDIEVPPESSVFVYLQRKGGDYDELWQCVGSSAVNEKKWSLDRVDFRLPLNISETRTTIQLLLRKGGETCSSLHNSEFSQTPKGSAASLFVIVPRPRVSIVEATLSRDESFIASGTAENIFEDREDLCVWVSGTRGGIATFKHCFRVTAVAGIWKVSEKTESEVRSGDKYSVEVGLVPRGFEDKVRPDTFAVLDRRERYVQ